MNRLAPSHCSTNQSAARAATTANTIIFQFTEEEIANVDLTRFLCLWEISPSGRPGLAKLRGNLCISFPNEGKGDAVFLCENTRAFCRRFFGAFPYWGFFFSLRNMSLWNLAMALVDNVQVVRFAPASRIRIAFADDGLSRIVSELVSGAQTVGQLAGYNADENEALSTDIRSYFERLVTCHAKP